MPGKFIVFEGVEGSGKTTQIEQTRAWLLSSPVIARLRQQNQVSQVITTREPGGTPIGKTLRQLLLQPSDEAIPDRTELLLYAADRAQHVETFLKPLLATGAVILCDRYTDSTVAYQGYGRGLNRLLIDQLNQIATNGLQSDLTFWLDVNVEVGLARARDRAAQDRNLIQKVILRWIGFDHIQTEIGIAREGIAQIPAINRQIVIHRLLGVR
ncbi:dTMP kinase [Leptolyngbya sp. 7M]|uniref:dTMP kinase n=1 Tax=Leptolyngbya sp. 7M TaxID=2812896 RepID=UPI001B8C04D9|nr:dTMP kinase [Leptolyngbya sp. 7M]QYO62964.1 dTMP kinase [Leptolyngbya sp. 7M]